MAEISLGSFSKNTAFIDRYVEKILTRIKKKSERLNEMFNNDLNKQIFYTKQRKLNDFR